MERKKIVIHYSGNFILDRQLVERWRTDFPQADIHECHGADVDDALLRSADAFVGKPTNAMLDAMPAVRWVQLHGAGIDPFMNNPHLRPDTVLTNASGVFGVPGAEHAVALLLALTRQIHLHVRQGLSRVWKQNERCLEVLDSTVAVIGLGDIGTQTAIRVKGLGAHVLAVKRTAVSKPDFVDELCTIDALDEVLKRSDFVINTLPLTAATRGLFSRERLFAMKQGAVFINIGRGETVDEAALIEALAQGHLEGAGLDVVRQEPLSPDSPLWTLPNVIITSHSVNTSPRKMERRAALIADNLRRFLAGEPLVNAVDLKLGY